MQLHNPPNVRLPPLMIDKPQEREAMESSPKSYNLIQSKLLLNNAAVALIRDIHKKSTEIDELIKSFKEQKYPFSRYRIILKRRQQTSKAMLRHRIMVRNKAGKFRVQGLSKDMVKLLAGYRAEEFKGAVTAIKRKSSRIQNLLSRFEKQCKVSLDILTPQTLFVCKKCHDIVSVDRFQIATCSCRAKVSRTSDIRREPVAYFDARTRNFIDNNYWFEYGVDYLLRRKNFQTLCGVLVLGHSGCSHEIDNVAESRSSNFRIFCECKTAEIRTADVFVFAGKMADIGCSRGYMFTLTAEPQKEIIHLARSRNISIISSVLNKRIEDLVKEIKEE